MAVSSGFFNSLNGDREYNARQFGALFDGIITDGVFINIGDALNVTAGTGNAVSVGSGKAWFNWAWVFNDAPLVLNLNPAHILLDRYDAVVVEINDEDAVRNGDIKVITGIASSMPQFPEMTHTETIHQYPLAYIFRPADSNGVLQSQIIDKRGTEECPFASGIMNVTGTMASLQITGNATPGQLQVVNVIFYTGDTPSLEGIPNGTLFIKYIS